MKKIMYLICNVSHGKGGHFYSLRTTVEAFQDVVCEPIVVNIGIQPSPVLEESKVSNYYIHFNGYNFFSVFSELNTLIKKHTPNAIHSFDIPSYFFGRGLSLKFKLPLVLTKCGGKNLKYTPYVQNFILYSKENLDYLQKQKKYNNTNFYLIPNRVNKIILDNKRIDNLKLDYNIDSGAIKLLRISRFVKAYEESIIQSINLLKTFKKVGINSQLLLIGEIQDEKIFRRIKQYCKGENNILFITDSKYTLNASALIGVADCVIGTGRGIMEAASMQKVLYTPLESKQMPILIDENNFQQLLSTNFSPRNKIKNIITKNTIKKEVNIVRDSKERELYMRFTDNIYKNYFDISSTINLYTKIYNNIIYKNDTKYIDIFLHLLFTSRSLYNSNKSYK